MGACVCVIYREIGELVDTHCSGIRDWVTISHVSHVFPRFPDAFDADEFDADALVAMTLTLGSIIHMSNRP